MDLALLFGGHWSVIEVKLVSRQGRARTLEEGFERWDLVSLPAPSIVRTAKIATIETKETEPIGRLPLGLRGEIEAILQSRFGAECSPTLRSHQVADGMNFLVCKFGICL